MRAAWAHSCGGGSAGTPAARFLPPSARALRRGLALSLALHALALALLAYLPARTTPPSVGSSGDRLVKVRLLAPAKARPPVAPPHPPPAAMAPARLPAPRSDDLAPARPGPTPAAARPITRLLLAPVATHERSISPEAISVAVVTEPSGIAVSLPAPAETGGVEFDTAPSPSEEIKPRYPPGARQRGEEGSLEAELLVEADGSVGGATIRRGSGFADLDRAALSALRAARFSPARRRGRPVAARIRITVVFRLTDA